MKFQFFTYFLLIILSLSCSDSSRQTKPAENNIKNKSAAAINPPSSYSDTLKINSAAAVFYSPDSLQLEKIKSVTDARVFEGSMHEYFYLVRNAHLVIKKYYPKLKIIEAKNVRYLLFTRADNKPDCIDLDKMYDPYGLFLFDGQTPSGLLDMANIETEIGLYFGK